jgi:hypothetical protein
VERKVSNKWRRYVFDRRDSAEKTDELKSDSNSSNDHDGSTSTSILSLFYIEAPPANVDLGVSVSYNAQENNANLDNEPIDRRLHQCR